MRVGSNDGCNLFHVVGPATENAQLPNLVYVHTVVAALVVDDESASSEIRHDRLN